MIYYLNTDFPQHSLVEHPAESLPKKEKQDEKKDESTLPA